MAHRTIGANHSSRFACLVFGAFFKTVRIVMFAEGIIFAYLDRDPLLPRVRPGKTGLAPQPTPSGASGVPSGVSVGCSDAGMRTAKVVMPFPTSMEIRPPKRRMMRWVM